jgi:uncharacterized membrane protein YbjE (DUF340 family)
MGRPTTRATSKRNSRLLLGTAERKSQESEPIQQSEQYDVPGLFSSVFPIFLSLIAGYIGGKLSPAKITHTFIRCIGPLVWLLLFSVGGEFGGVLGESSVARGALLTSLVFAVLTTLIPGLLVSYFYGQHRTTSDSQTGHTGSISVWLTVRECVVALSMVAAGALLSRLPGLQGVEHYWARGTSLLLMLLIFLVGMDLSCLQVQRSWWSRRALLIPLIVLMGSLAGGVIGALVLQEEMSVALALSSGFGWFSLSGALVGGFLGPTYGAIALMTDLFRELIAILLLYIAGRTYPFTGIAASGAAAMDSTLPIIRQTCRPTDVPVALVSGFLLTIAAPMLIAFFLS